MCVSCSPPSPSVLPIGREITGAPDCCPPIGLTLFPFAWLALLSFPERWCFFRFLIISDCWLRAYTCCREELSVTEHSDRNVLCKPDILWCVEQISSIHNRNVILTLYPTECIWCWWCCWLKGIVMSVTYYPSTFNGKHLKDSPRLSLPTRIR